MIQAASADPERPRRLLEEVLARPEFHRGDAGAPGWLDQLLNDLFQAADSLPGWVGIAVLTAMVGLGGVFIAQVLSEGSAFRRRRAAADGPEPAVETRVSAVALFRDGRRAMDAGHLSDAVVLLFRAMVARLTERGFLLPDPSRTNREHLRDLRGRPEESRALRDTVPLFERIRYGEQPAGADDAARVLSAATALFPDAES